MVDNIPKSVVNTVDSNILIADPKAVPKQPKKRFIGKRALAEKTPINESIEDSGSLQVSHPRRPTRALNSIPQDLLDDPDIKDAIALLPPNYNFEIHKTIHRIRTSNAKNVALQFPEGLLLFATTISDIINRFCPKTTTLIMGDVTYGACCIDDFTAQALGCDLLIHYAHSCLIPMTTTKIPTLYVFVSIGIDTAHLIATIVQNFQIGKNIALVGTIQFNAAIHSIAPVLRREGYIVIIPQIAPLSKGEILGCTSPNLRAPGSSQDLTLLGKDENAADALIYIGDGRFHLESAMIANPTLPAYRYDPYSRRLTHEQFSHNEMYSLRRNAILSARQAQTWGLILGTLGRQGNPHTLSLIESRLVERGIKCIRLLLSEIFPGKLASMPEVETWVQVACPRLSIDWGYAFPRPLLSPYEALVALEEKEANWMSSSSGDTGIYPMNFYGKDGLGRTRAEASNVTLCD